VPSGPRWHDVLDVQAAEAASPSHRRREGCAIIEIRQSLN
jgi:hypothetical protein